MRSEAEMMALILKTAQADERVRAVVLNGSRADSLVPRDKYQDYDIVYFVRELEPFICNMDFIAVFGERIILEMPAYKDFAPDAYGGRFNYQMLFTDGNRIDLTFAALTHMQEALRDDRMGRVLLDKDGLLANHTFSDGEYYFVKPFTTRAFENACNGFWWVVQNVAKGLARQELPCAMQMLTIAREDLDKLVSWHIGRAHDFKVNTGKMGKYFEKHLAPQLWARYKSCFPTLDAENIWAALFAACGLFRTLGTQIAAACGYEYPQNDDDGMTAYLRGVYKPAQSICLI